MLRAMFHRRLEDSDNELEEVVVFIVYGPFLFLSFLYRPTIHSDQIENQDDNDTANLAIQMF